jgi:hypothetical protein
MVTTARSKIVPSRDVHGATRSAHRGAKRCTSRPAVSGIRIVIPISSRDLPRADGRLLPEHAPDYFDHEGQLARWPTATRLPAVRTRARGCLPASVAFPGRIGGIGAIDIARRPTRTGCARSKARPIQTATDRYDDVHGGEGAQQPVRWAEHRTNEARRVRERRVSAQREHQQQDAGGCEELDDSRDRAWRYKRRQHGPCPGSDGPALRLAESKSDGQMRPFNWPSELGL